MHAFVLAAESASQPITVRHFTGSDACHIIRGIIIWQTSLPVKWRTVIG